jgi:3'-5' exoribonuclease 1
MLGPKLQKFSLNRLFRFSFSRINMDSKTPYFDSLSQELKAMGIKPKGTVAAMEKQLRKAKKSQETQLKEKQTAEKQLAEQLKKDSKAQPFDYYLICDVEATCDENSRFDYASEIIEFPVLLVRGADLKIIDTFHKYVCPTLKPKLTDFCINLTGITQKVVDEASTFSTVYEEFKTWLSKYDEAPFKNCIFVTDGVWDLRDFFEKVDFD